MSEISFEQAIQNAIVEKFFQPEVTGAITRPRSGWSGEPSTQLIYGKHPLDDVVQKIYDQAGDRLVHQVIKKLDMNEIATKVSDILVRRLSESSYGYTHSEGKELQEKVTEKLANKLATKALKNIECKDVSKDA